MYSNKVNIKKSVLKSVLPIFSLFFFVGTVHYFNSKVYGLELKYNNKSVITVPNEQTYNKAVYSVLSEVLPEEKSKIRNLNTKLEITELDNTQKYCENLDLIKNKIVENSNDNLVSGYALYVDQNIITISENQEDLNNSLNNILDFYKSVFSNSDQEILNIMFQENIEIRSGMFPKEKIKNIQEIQEILNSKIQKTSLYTIKQNESMSDIIKKFDTNIQTLCIINNKKKFYYGDTINVPVYDNLLHVEVTCQEKILQEIPFEIQIIEDPNLLRNTENIIQSGILGTKRITQKIIYNNKKEISRVNTQEEVISDPVTEKVIIGTKIQEWLWPVPYTTKITSPYGPRWGGFHYGIDIAKFGVLGSDILATKSGTVEKICYSSMGYGNHVIINHGNHVKSLYAHCKDILVTTIGQTVSQGDKIATVGSTGDSTGPHLHFEIRINGSQVNPSLYLK